MRLTPDQRDPITRPKNLSRQIALESTFYTVPPIFQILFGVVTLPKTSPLDVVFVFFAFYILWFLWPPYSVHVGPE